MKLKHALEIAESCGLENVSEAIRNIRIHSPSLFVLDLIDIEIRQMMEEWYGAMSAGGFTRESSVRDVMEWIKLKEKEG